MEKVDTVVVGAGVVGLAVAWELSKVNNEVFVIEKNSNFGQETSSRNSEVIHAGIHYPKESLKARTCIEGKQLLYEFCAANSIAHKRTGKLMVAINENEAGDLRNLLQQGLENGIEDLKLLSKDEIRNFEPNIKAEEAIYSPSTGIIDSHSLMNNLALQFRSRQGNIAYNSELIAIDKAKGGFIITVKDNTQGHFKFLTRFLINCAGLNSDKVAALAGLLKDEYKLKYCKGDYFRVHNNKAKYISRLIYPLPKHNRPGLGIHATLDLAGGLRLGPDDEYVKEVDYKIDAAKGKIFYESVKTFLPFIDTVDLAPDTSGIRPKLQGPNESLRDFIIREETANGLQGLINLIGIESPGLTGSLSIAKMVREIKNKLDK